MPKASTIFRVIVGFAAVVLGVSLVLTQLTSFDASSCEMSAADGSSTGKLPKIPDGVPVYLEVMSGDVELNRKLRAGLEEALAGHEIVERSARHAPKGAAGVKLIVALWAPKWFPLRAAGSTTLEGEVRVGQEKFNKKETISVHCLGIVNKDGFIGAEGERMLDWAKKSLEL